MKPYDSLMSSSKEPTEPNKEKYIEQKKTQQMNVTNVEKEENYIGQNKEFRTVYFSFGSRWTWRV